VNSISEKTGLTRYGIRYIVREIGLNIIHQVILLISAGIIWWINAWIYFIVTLSYQIINILLLYRLNPQVLNERGKIFQENTKFFDKIFVVLYIMIVLGSPIIVGFDVVRFKFSLMPCGLSIFGIILLVGASALGSWAMVVNTHFEMTVRIQEERNHQVCTTGPYKIVRHPGYAAEIIAIPSYPLIFGSWWGFVPMIGLIALFIVRTALEDRTLKRELAGYKEYAEKTRYRLIPFIW
jgi:protein-S-isoprenylcysteine O-methyltransferase Ste14